MTMATPPTTNWGKVPISTVYAGLYDGPHATPKPSNEGPVFLGIGNITEDGHLDLSNVRHIAEDDFPRWTRRVEPRPGDIVFVYEAALNRYAIIPEGFRGCLGRRLALIRPDESKALGRFMFYSFFSEDWHRTVARNTLSGATVDRIPLTSFPTFELNLPPLHIQEKTVAILSAYDDLIENNSRRAAILEETARLIYEEWFIRYRFPGHGRVPLTDSKLGLIPEGWPIVTASDAMFVNPKAQVRREAEKPFVPMNALSHNSMLVSAVESRTGNNGAKFRNGDTLFARITPCLENGKTAYVQFLQSEDAIAFGSTEFIVLRSRTLCPEFVYLLSRSQPFRDNAIKSMSGATGRQRVQEGCFIKFLLAQPPQELLSAFGDFARPVFRSVQLLADKNDVLRRSRALLLPKLISGELDVSDLNLEVEELAT